MVLDSLKSSYSEGGSQVLWEDGERVFRRGWRTNEAGEPCPALFVVAAGEHPSRSSLDRLRHEYELRSELDAAWAVRPLELVHDAGRIVLVLEDAGDEPLERLLGAPMESGRFLRLAIGIATALGEFHRRGFVHKDIKPSHILVNGATGVVRLTGFGVASRLVRERQALHPPEMLAGTLAYMAPEQTGRMNRSIDSRSDLYALGVVLYRMLTGTLPFSATEPMEWVHCHVARRAVTPAERINEIPSAVSGIVMKLLAKRAEDRYQTAAGLAHDLRRCQTEWAAERRIDAFPLGEHDSTDRLMIPEKLYGRQHEVEALLGAFDRVVTQGTPELVLVSGYSGVGKSSVVHELQPVLVPPRGLFASGKFDQYKRDVPYSTVAQGFQTLVRPLLSKSEADLAPWRDALMDALGPNAGLIVDLVPEVKLIIGEPPLVPELPPQDAQRRFQLVFRRFIGVFARPEHPLALFLDDLQWLDSATLDLLEDLIRSDLRHLLVIGAYRDNEVTAAHPLMRKLEAIKNAGGNVKHIKLAPLAQEHLEQLLADCLGSATERAKPLAQLVHRKTAGNPFFAIQFIHALADEGMLAFDYRSAQWSWDFDRIHAKNYSDNVVDLMVGRISRLPIETQMALQRLGCLGNVAEIALLSIALECSEDQVHASLWAALRAELVQRVEDSYKFTHDRIQEAAYSLIPEELRAQAHLRIGRALVAQIAPAKREEVVFDIVNQLNRGAGLITSQDERDQLAELNLLAARRAKSSAAYVSALQYLVAGAVLLAEDCWERRADLAFALELGRAECEFLTGELAAADGRLAALANRATSIAERAALALLHMGVCTELARADRAVAVALNYLRDVGIEFSPHPTAAEVQVEYEQIWSQLAGRSIEDVVDWPLMSDRDSLAVVDVLTGIMIPAVATDQNLDSLTTCRAVNVSLARGNCDASSLAYVNLARVAIERFHDYSLGFRLGQVGFELVERRGLKRFQAGTYLFFATFVLPWMKHMRASVELLRRAFDAANKVGNLTYAGYANCCLHAALLVAGAALRTVQRESEFGLSFAQQARFTSHIDYIWPQLALVRTLRGLTPKFGCLDHDGFEEAAFEHHLAENPSLRIHECWYWIRKMQARFLAGDYTEAVAASTKAQGLLWIARGYIEKSDYHFYSALSRAAYCDCALSDDRLEHLEALANHQRQLGVWAENCPDNFEGRAALVSAEIARLENRDLDAMRLYEGSIRSSHNRALVHDEAIAYERAAAFYRGRGFEQFSDTYLRAARACYASWGADGKIGQLDRLYPGIRPEESLVDPTATITAPVEGLDLATMIRVSQAVSSEMVLERLLDILMRKAMEYAGAERGLLILTRGGQLEVEAESQTSDKGVFVRLREASVFAAPFPESIVRFVMRTHESVILDDASSGGPFSADAYIVQYRARSVLCLPLLNQTKLTGILYLENNLAPRVFAPERITVLKVLASQAAISLENTRLYRDLEDRERRIRRLVDANIMGILVADLGGRILEANDAFLNIVGYSREDFVSGRVRWTELTPSEWRERDLRSVAELNATGTAQPYEKEYFRKDGSRVPVLIGAALFEEGGNEGVAFVLDLTDRKRGESALRQLESDLAHMNRVSMMGELTAALAHEVKQPIAAARNNARATQNFLNMHPPNLEEVSEAVGCIVGDVDRAGEIIDRIGEQIKKAPPRKARCDLNAAICDVIGLARSVAEKGGVSIESRLADGLPYVQGDRVQLQQVVLNLMLNAIEAMGSVEGGIRELSITTEQDPLSGVLVTVRDSGPGIDPQHLERIFQSFYTTKPGGTGMGLSVCRSIIDAHGGRLWADANQSPGAVFRFTLPAVDGSS